jgi:arylsulfatase A-like enzyme
LKGKDKKLSGTLVANENETGIDKIAVKGKSVRMEFKLDVEGDLRDIAIEATMESAKSLNGKWILLDSDGNEEVSGDWVAERTKDETSEKKPAKSKTGAVSNGSQPNILLIMTDQHAATALSCVGNRDLKTPTLDQLAAEGVRFDRAYVTQPLCLPCRSSLQTGRYPHEIGTISNGRPIQGEFPLLGNLVNDAGYESAYIGKWHVGTTLEQAGYSETVSPKRDRDKSQIAREFLMRERDKPFFLTVSFLNPHNVCQLARGQELPDGPIGKPPGLLNELPSLPDNFDVPENEPTAIRKVQASSNSHYPTKDWDELKWRQYLWGYYRLVEKVDAEIATVIDALDKCGQRDNTVVIFVSDHGEGVAMHHWNQKQILYEQSVRVPFFISWRGKTKPRVTDMLASVSLDIPATILSFAGAEKPESMRGMSLKEFALGGTVAKERDFVVAETMFAKGDRSLGLVGRMIRTKKYKYCVYDVGQQREQLFDMDADPGEMKNLVVDASFSDEVNRHRVMITDWARQTSDSDFPYVKVK